MLFVVHATDKSDGIVKRAKFYRAHRIHLDQANGYDVDVVTAGTLLANDGETPVGSIFVIDAKDRAAAHLFTRSDPYYLNEVWARCHEPERFVHPEDGSTGGLERRSAGWRRVPT